MHWLNLSGVPEDVLSITLEKWRNVTYDSVEQGTSWVTCPMCYYAQELPGEEHTCVKCPLSAPLPEFELVGYAFCKSSGIYSLLHPRCEYYDDLEIRDKRLAWRKTVKNFCKELEDELNSRQEPVITEGEDFVLIEGKTVNENFFVTYVWEGEKFEHFSSYLAERYGRQGEFYQAVLGVSPEDARVAGWFPSGNAFNNNCDGWKKMIAERGKVDVKTETKSVSLKAMILEGAGNPLQYLEEIAKIKNHKEG